METAAIIIGIIVGLLLILAITIKYAAKGKVAERLVAFSLKFLGKKYRILNNVLIKNEEKSSQIDHIVISNYGVFVIETKDYSGKIYGSEKAEKFTQYIGKKKYEFYNPIKQNLGHIYALDKAIGNYKYISIVIFTATSKRKITSETFIGTPSSTLKYIKNYKQDKIYSDEQVKDIFERISQKNISNKNNNKEHIIQVQQTKQSYENAISNNICPKCGGKLIERQGKNGNFFGCSNYPKCKFTKRI